jgi:formylglycine-generating enzyme required for sulfatase activity
MNEEPVHKVYLDKFYIDTYEVSNTLYKSCVDENICQSPKDMSSYTRTIYYGNPQYDNYPVIHVDWNQAKTYCEWRGGGLPTEAQWEKAARGPNASYYPWGNSIDGPRMNFCDSTCIWDWANKSFSDDYLLTAPVDAYPDGVSYYGVYNMAGNVWEWVADWYSDVYYQNSPAINPTGPNTGTFRVSRGGSYMNDASLIRLTRRLAVGPSYATELQGFRCVKNTNP